MWKLSTSKGTKNLCKNSWNLVKENLKYHIYILWTNGWIMTIVNMSCLFLVYKKFHFILALILQLNKLDSWCRLLHNLPFLWSLIYFIFQFLVKADDSKFCNDLKKNYVDEINKIPYCYLLFEQNLYNYNFNDCFQFNPQLNHMWFFSFLDLSHLFV